MKKIVLVDGMSLAFRAFHAMDHRNKDKALTMSEEAYDQLVAKESIKLFSNFMGDINKRERPDYSILAWDAQSGTETWRAELFPEYKGNRENAKNPLSIMILAMNYFAEQYGFTNLYSPGFEADDIIGTAVNLYEKDHKCVIISGDRDFLQLVSTNTEVQITKQGVNTFEAYDYKRVEEEYGVKINQMVDYKALVGDSSDNYKGVIGVGPVAAKGLLNQFKDIDDIYLNIDDISKKGVKNKMINGEEDARLFQKIAAISKDAPANYNLENIEHKAVKQSSINKALIEMQDENLVMYFEQLVFG